MAMDLNKASATSSFWDWKWVNLESPRDWDSLKHTSAVKDNTLGKVMDTIEHSKETSW